MQQSLRTFFESLGISLTADALLIIGMLIAAIFGSLFTWVFQRSKREALVLQHADQLRAQQQLADDQADQISHTFSTLSTRALQQNNDAFLTLAKQNFEQLRLAAAGDLQSRQQSFSNLVKPIEESLKATEQQLKQFDSNRNVGDAKLSEQISSLLETQHLLNNETRNLSKALRRPEVRGQWGELTLRRLVELAGLSEYCDFSEQTTIDTDEGRIRPDMLINLPSQRQLIVDVKTPLDAYISAAESVEPSTRDEFLTKHAKNLKQRVSELAAKQYWQQFEQAPDFVILFIPGDQFLSSALQFDSTLLEFALEKQVLLATPTSLVGLLRAIAYGWNQNVLSQNTTELRKVGQTLVTRLHTLTEHLNKLGGHIDQTVTQFNRVAGSFQQNTVPASKRLSELGVGEQSEPAPQPQPSSGSLTRKLPGDTTLQNQAQRNE